MTSNSIENLLRSAPAPAPPASLSDDLRRGIRLETAARVPPESRWKRWWPVLVPGTTLLALAAVVSVQQAELQRLETRRTAPPVGQPAIDAGIPASDPAASLSDPDVGTDPRLELQALRTRVAELQRATETESALVAETERLKAELEAARAALPPEMSAMADAQERAQRIRCVNNLKQLGLAVRIFASDHEDDFPPDLKSIVSLVGAGDVFYCPSDPNRPAADPTVSAEVAASKSSYEFTAPGPGAFETEPTRVCFICPIHRNVTLCDGSVQQLTAERFAALVRRDGKIYLESNATIAPTHQP